MTLPFNRHRGLVIVPARLWGPNGHMSARLVLDTGADVSVVNRDILVWLGCDPGVAPEQIQMATASGLVLVPRVRIDRIEALDRERRAFPVVCHTLPASTRVDGVLGLDFFRGCRLVLDFRAGLVSLD